MLIYRLVSWIFISAIGWVVFFFMFRTEGALDPEAVVDEMERLRADMETSAAASVAVEDGTSTVAGATAAPASPARERRGFGGPSNRRRNDRPAGLRGSFSGDQLRDGAALFGEFVVVQQ